MRIALVGPFAPFRGGIAQFNDRLRDELLKRNHEVQAVTFSRQYPGVLFPGSTQYDPSRSGDARPLVDSVNPVSWWRAGRAIRSGKPDVVIPAYWTPHLAPALAGVLASAGAPALGLIHNARPHGGSVLSNPLGKLFINRLNGAVTLSDSVSGDLKDMGFKGVVETAFHPVYDHFGEPLAPEDARKQLGLPAAGPVLLCLGLVRRYKGFDRAVDAFGEVLAERPDATLVIAGEAYDDSLDAAMKRLSPEARKRVVRSPEYVPDAQVPLYYSAADLLLLPYRTATQSGALAAAAHFGLPVVVSEAPGLAAPAREYGMGLVSRDGALAGTILEALKPERAAALSEGSRSMARKASWSRFAEVLETLAQRC
ncbi:MAG: glycosyltransferase [Rhodothermales bacterium]|nr:glycosyltransferase [Rhodothermales bacterium]